MGILRHLLREPQVGRWYGIQLANGDSKVIELEYDQTGCWSRVLLEYTAGCLLAPPEDDPDAPEDEWTLPIARSWLTRDEWLAYGRGVSAEEWPLQEDDDADEDDGSGLTKPGPDVLAIVKRSVFEQHARDAAPRDILPWATYLSQHPQLRLLGPGSRLFLVTVRPPDERLWLVAVYPGVQLIRDSLRSVSTNELPIVDISHLRPALKFQSGKGMLQAAGKLGNSLQTPRILTAADLDLLEEAVGDADAVVPHHRGPKPCPGVPFDPYSSAPSSAEHLAEDDRDVIDRDDRVHASTRRALAEFVRKQGWAPRSAAPGEPDYDLAWQSDGSIFVAVVRSLGANEERQLRLGLGRALHHQAWFDSFLFNAEALLVVDQPPSDDLWADVCDREGVWLVWPGAFGQLIQEDGEDEEDEEQGVEEEDEQRYEVIHAPEPRTIDLNRDVLVFQMPESFGSLDGSNEVMRCALTVVAMLFRTEAQRRRPDATWLAFVTDGQPHVNGLSVWLGLSKSVPAPVLDLIQQLLEGQGARVHREFARAHSHQLKPALCLSDDGFEVLQTGHWDALGEGDAELFALDGDVVIRTVRFSSGSDPL